MARAMDRVDVDDHAMDVEDDPALTRLMDKVLGSREPIVLRRDGMPVAVVLTVDAAEALEGNRKPTEAERAAFRMTAGGWKGLIDIDRFIEDNYESRRRSSRPAVEFE